MDIAFLNYWSCFYTDVISPNKSAAIVSPSQQQKLTKPADDITGASPSPQAGVIEPAACKQKFFSAAFKLFYEWISYILGLIITLLNPSKLICCKHFLQQKVLFEEGLTILGWMTKFC